MKKILVLVLALILALPMAANSESATATLQEMYAQAELLMAQGDYTGAAAKFEALGAYSDASQMTMYCKAIAAAETLGLYSMAIDAFNDLGDFKDSKQMAKYYEGRAYEASGNIDVTTASDAALEQAIWSYQEAEKIYGGLAFFKDSLTRMGACGERIKEIKSEQSRRAEAKKEATYQNALALEQSGDYAGAIKLYQTIKGYKDSNDRISICQTAINEGIYQEALALEQSGDYAGAVRFYQTIKGYKDSNDRFNECIYQQALSLEQNGDYAGAIALYQSIENHKDSAERIPRLYYSYAEILMSEGKWDEASEAFKNAGEYNDAAERINEPYYLHAAALAEEGNYNEAHMLYVGLKDYKDSAAQAASIRKEHGYDIIKNAKVGDYIPFGSYEQDNDLSNGPEFIEWLVVEKQGDVAFVVSRYMLDCQHWGSQQDRDKDFSHVLTWGTSNLRRWLNNTFLDAAFTEDEKNVIVNTTVESDHSKAISRSQVSQRVFALSPAEITGKLGDCQATDYAKAKGVNEKKGFWLRGHSYDSNEAQTSTGKRPVTSADVGVRPAMWLDPALGETMSNSIPYEIGTVIRFNDGREAVVKELEWVQAGESTKVMLLCTYEFTKGGKPGEFVFYLDEQLRLGYVEIVE